VSYHPYVTNLILLLYVAVYYYFIKNLSNSIQAFEIKHGMFAGSIVGLVSAVCSMPLLWIYFNYIEVEFFDNMIAAALKKALQENESVLVALNDARSYFNLQSYLLQSLFFNLVIGLLLSLLFSYRIVKSQKIKK
jgi:formate hydrogenlyase subunit 4